ncbi:MAG: hypothetical protein AAF433_17655 [Bacteroidota bacterium]
MQRTKYLLFACLGMMLTFSSCLRDECDAVLTYVGYEPIIIYPEDFRVTIQATGPQELCEPAGFYYYQNHLMIIERNEGLHIINNSNPAAPRSLSFLPVKGAQAVAVSNDVLYINNATDLVTFDLTDLSSPQMLGRTEDVFTAYSFFGQGQVSNGGIVIDYMETELTEFISCSDVLSNDWWFWQNDIFFINRGRNEAIAFATSLDNTSNFNGNAAGGEQNVGIGGSLARFTINNGTLYAVDESQLITLDLSNPAQPSRQAPIQLGWGIETIFPYGDLLFIGSRTGMHIYDGSDPLAPVQLSVFEHAQSCDPVYVNGDLAYVTLRSGRDEDWCNTVTNRLEIVNVSDPTNPVLVEAYDLTFPAGLTVTDELLFLCEGDHGFKVFDLQPNGLLGEELIHRTDIDAMDVIGLHWLQQLITIDDSGLNQLSYDNEGNLEDLSSLTNCDN